MFLNGPVIRAVGHCVCEQGCSQWMLVIEVIGVTPS